MERNESSEQRAIFTLLGELSSDVKHILAQLDANKRETEELKKHVDQKLTDQEKRLTEVEKFNTRAIAIASVALPFLLAVINWGVPYILSVL